MFFAVIGKHEPGFHRKLAGRKAPVQRFFTIAIWKKRELREYKHFRQERSSLLSDTELAKNIAKYFIGSDFACDRPQVVKGLTDINGD